MNRLVPSEIESYAEAHSIPESSVCRALREETQRTMEYPQMLVGPLEGAFLKMMTQLVGAKRVLEIGMFTGYSALCFAEALPEDGTVITCEINEPSAVVARRYVAQAQCGSKISIRMGPALDTMRTLSGPFDLIFIDADKINYLNYYRRALDLL
ncbi:MAG: class I SAM-dependent methyltransferase, partial [Nitrospira sp.]|nr:class I SAM-dependent methyltransferase [Nitrospira sp.]